MSQSQAKLQDFRGQLQACGLAGFIVPKDDEFQNESVPAYADRLAFLTGFTGSAGIAVILMDKAALFVDSRYSLQAKAETDQAQYFVELWPKTAAHTWLAEQAKQGDIIGYDPKVHTLAGFKAFRQVAEKHGLLLQACMENPLESLWLDRSVPVFPPLFGHDIAFAGEAAHEKLARVQQSVAESGAGGLFIGAPDSVAWLFNIRGRDVAYTPLPLIRSFVPFSGRPVLFVQDGHVTPQNKTLLEAFADVENLADLEAALKTKISEGTKVLADPSRTTLHIADTLKKCGAALVETPDPCVLFKARKNPVECEGARAAHKRDGVALCRFLAWLDANAADGTLDEIMAAAKLGAFRCELDLFEGESFETISGAGANGAIVHYRVTAASNKSLMPNSLYLIDSGGQFKDGTTDVTRTVAIGTPTREMRRHFTLVLKGHIALATARFPQGTRGVDLDAFARRALWAAGLDYGHGTGHGVGSFLSVHEGPQGFSRNATAALEPGMIVSNEPGYYREGHYGIRIENLMLVKAPDTVEGGEVPMLSFETLTFAPIDRRLIDVALLSPDELAWLNAYHVRVHAEISPLLDDGERTWLQRVTSSFSAIAH